MSSDAERIRTLSETFMLAVNAGDISGWMDTLTNDIIVMPPEQKSAVGSDAVRAWALENYFEPYNINLEFSFDEIHVAGSWAFGRGPFRQLLTPKEGGELLEVRGKFIDVFHTASGGEWKFARIIFNADEPVTVV